MLTEDNRDLARVIADAQAGDASAFTVLYSRYAGMILRYLYARTREQESAQDLTQEVFVRVLRSIGTFEFRGERSWLGWLYTIAANVLIGQVRRKQPISTPLDAGDELVDQRGTEAVHSIHDRLELQQALAQLTTDQQQVLTLKFFADLNNNEIAQTLGRTEGAVKALQHRALASLQTILKRHRQEFAPVAVLNGEAEHVAHNHAGSSDITSE
jgi:RNA polymerase sigma-70 factor, ECF subfamily